VKHQVVHKQNQNHGYFIPTLQKSCNGNKIRDNKHQLKKKNKLQGAVIQSNKVSLLNAFNSLQHEMGKYLILEKK